jgi:hypothetical protein
MAKKQIIDIDAEFDGIEFDEREIIQETRRAKISNSTIGKPKKQETKDAISVARKGKKQSAETRAKNSASNKGKKLSTDHCKKVSASLIGTRRGAKPVVTPFGIFDSLKNTALNLNKHVDTIARYIKLYPKEYYYITKEEYIMLTGKDI